MKYENKELTIDQIVAYLRDKKINLSPIFQRNRVWSLPSRQALIKNILRHRPIPAIFIYKDDTQSDYRYEYSILDGKQRLESIMMFIGEENPHMSIPTVNEYIFDRNQRKHIGFSVDLGDGNGNQKFKRLTKELKAFGEYPIATIYVTIDEASQLDEVINLFVDINQRGEKVTRLDIVKAMKLKDPFLNELYSLIGERQERKQDVYVKWRGSNFTSVLKNLSIVSRGGDRAIQADRMWQVVVELALSGDFPISTPSERQDLLNKLQAFAKLIVSEPRAITAVGDPDLKAYLEQSLRQTTDAEKRKGRKRLFKLVVSKL